MFKKAIQSNISKGFNLSKKFLVRGFSSKQNLVNCFTTEINYEEGEYKPISSEEKQVFLKNTGFEFLESETSPKMELKKTINGFQVQIRYHARAPLPNQEEELDENQKEAEPGNMTDIQVLIQKEGKTSGFLVDAVVIDGNISVNAVHISDNIQEFYAKIMTGKVDPDIYEGPDFQSLDENLQQAFFEFLGELGIGEETAAFIEVTSLDKDQFLYMNWLKTCKNLLI